jgi:hypothetical protein
MLVPELRTHGRQGNPFGAATWRAERQQLREEGDDGPLKLAVVTDGSDRGLGEAVRAGGGHIVGLLAPDPLESLAWAAEVGAPYGYSALEALRGDEIEGAVLDLGLDEATQVAELLLEEGAGVVFARPEVPRREGARALLQAVAMSNAPATVALRTRAWESATAAVRLAPDLAPFSQVTVAHWPASRAARAELCDLVRRLCGDIGGVCAALGLMPAPELAPGLPVTLAFVTEELTTIMVNESPRAVLGDAQLTFIGAHGRMVLGQRGLTVSDVSGVREIKLRPSPDPVSFAVAALQREFGGAPHAAAGLGDALATARVLEVAAESYELGTWAPTA